MAGIDKMTGLVLACFGGSAWSLATAAGFSVCLETAPAWSGSTFCFLRCFSNSAGVVWTRSSTSLAGSPFSAARTKALLIRTARTTSMTIRDFRARTGRSGSLISLALRTDAEGIRNHFRQIHDDAIGIGKQKGAEIHRIGKIGDESGAGQVAAHASILGDRESVTTARADCQRDCAQHQGERRLMSHQPERFIRTLVPLPLAADKRSRGTMILSLRMIKLRIKVTL